MSRIIPPQDTDSLKKSLNAVEKDLEAVIEEAASKALQELECSEGEGSDDLEYVD